jgi:hypothetical protein
VADEAQAYVARYYAVPAGSAQAAEPSTRIVYAAIDGQPSSYGYDSAANVSGVLERLPLAAMRETLLTLRNGQPARLAVIGPVDPTGVAQMQQVQAFDWSPHTHDLWVFGGRLLHVAPSVEQNFLRVALQFSPIMNKDQSLRPLLDTGRTPSGEPQADQRRAFLCLKALGPQESVREDRAPAPQGAPDLLPPPRRYPSVPRLSQSAAAGIWLRPRISLG